MSETDIEILNKEIEFFQLNLDSLELQGLGDSESANQMRENIAICLASIEEIENN